MSVVPDQNPLDEPLRSVHTSTFPSLLKQIRASLLVTTYQAGKVIAVRADGDVLNTHFRPMRKPMGLAISGPRLAIGSTDRIYEYRDVPAVTTKLETPGKHDACFVPWSSKVTGNVDIHEMAWGDNHALWFVNTRFSCLCLHDLEHSFRPTWRPPFVSALAPEDRCHLNGLAMHRLIPRYATALGASDTPGGWRDGKANAGILIDIGRDVVLAEGLSMPHSPRCYGGRLWLLESGRGTLACADPRTGAIETVAELPGFTRGLDFAGPIAFVGLSKVRETAVFSGIPITESSSERHCGVWAVNIDNGDIIAFLRFDAAVQEIFAVTLIPGVTFPEILEQDDKLLATSYVLPDDALEQVPAGLRTSHR